MPGIGKEKRYMEMENFFFDNSGHLSLKGILFYVHSMHKIPLRDLKNWQYQYNRKNNCSYFQSIKLWNFIVSQKIIARSFVVQQRKQTRKKALKT